MEWQDYEQLVHRIYERLGKEHGVTIVCSGHLCKVKGVSGVEHQIDVLTTFTDGIHTYKTAIECKHWQDKVDKTIVMQVEHIQRDAGLAKTVIVTTAGFTPDAVTYAKANHVELVTLRRTIDDDWVGRIQEIVINLHITTPRITKAIFTPARPAEKLPSTNSRECVLEYPGGRKEPLNTVLQGFMDRMDLQRMKETQTEVIPFTAPTTLSDGVSHIEVVNLRLEGVFDEGPGEKLTINGRDHVAYIMQTEFSRYVVDKDGNAREKP